MTKMELDFTFINLIDILGFVQGTLLGILLILQFRKQISFLLLGLFLIGYSADLITSFADNNEVFQIKILYLPINFYFLFMPSLYLYAQSLTRKVDWKKEIKHFIPAILEFLIFSFLFFRKDKVEIYNSDLGELIESIYIIIAWIVITTYAILIIRFVQRLKKKVENFYSNIKGKLLDWVKWVAIYVVVFNIIMMFSSLFFSKEFDNNWVIPAMSSMNVIFIFWVALSGFRQTQIEFSDIDKNLEKSNVETQKKEILNIESNVLDADFEKIKIYLSSEKSFKNPQLNLASLANELHFSQRKLSNLINEKANLNFNKFINQYRIEEAKALLVDENYTHLNMLGIAYEVGFNSKATFYAVFKQMTGTTPNKFQKEKLLAS